MAYPMAWHRGTSHGASSSPHCCASVSVRVDCSRLTAVGEGESKGEYYFRVNKRKSYEEVFNPHEMAQSSSPCSLLTVDNAERDSVCTSLLGFGRNEISTKTTRGRIKRRSKDFSPARSLSFFYYFYHIRNDFSSPRRKIKAHCERAERKSAIRNRVNTFAGEVAVRFSIT